MLTPEEATQAINYFLKDIENLEVGNPLPFVTSYSSNDEGGQSYKYFNELMFNNGSLQNIFYGEITFSCPKVDPSNNLKALISKKLDFSDPFHSIYLEDLTSVNGAIMWTSKPLFIQKLEMGGNSFLSFNGYLFGLETT